MNIETIARKKASRDGLRRVAAYCRVSDESERLLSRSARLEPVAEFRESLWLCLAESMTVVSHSEIYVDFRDGTHVTA